jgi:hypothetical protein
VSFVDEIFGGGNQVKTITKAQFKKLRAIENAARNYAYKLKGDWGSSRKLEEYYYKWGAYADSLDITDLYGREVRYKVEGMGAQGDFSYGYSLGDAMA